MQVVNAASVALKIEALFDPWAFIDLLGFQGGTKEFDVCHYDFMLVLAAPQMFAAGRLTVELARRWATICELDSETLVRGRNVIRPPNNRLLQMPRGHLKSTVCIAYILWRIYRNPNIRILHACNVRELSEAFIRELRGYFEDGDLLDAVWNSRPHIRGKLVPALDKSNRRYYGDENEAADRKVVWSNQQLQMVRDSKAKEPTVLSTSVKAKATGQHYDLIVMDDIVDMDNSETPSKLKRVKRWAGDIASIRTKIAYTSHCGVLPDGTRFDETLGDEYVVTGTHYDPGDYYAFIKENAKALQFVVMNRNIYANGADASNGYLWGRFTERMEEELRAELSDLPGVFEAQYLNLVNNPALQVITTDFIEWVPTGVLLEGRSNMGVTFRKPLDGTLDSVIPIMAVDFAVSLSARADYTAIAVGGKTFQRALAALDFSVGHYSTEKTLDEIVAMVRKWGIRRMYVETIGFQSLYRSMIIKRLTDEQLQCGVLDFKPVGNKEKRIESQLSTYFSTGNVYFSEHLKRNAAVMNSFSFFGRASAKDDPPDALSVVAQHSYPPEEKARRFSTSLFDRDDGDDGNISKYGRLVR